MEDCELCGNPTSTVFVVNVEDVELRVCPKCAKGKRVVYKEEPKRAIAKKGLITKPKKLRPEEAEIVEDYGTIVRKARESMRLPIKVLGEMINEKQSLLLRVEQQRTKPSMVLAKKLEKALNIKLEQENEDTHAKRELQSGKNNATLGEFVD
jgi:putative transcription factor